MPVFSLSVSLTTEAVLRIVFLSVAAYDYLLTLPAEWSLYTSQRPLRSKLNASNVHFILIRYVSICALFVSNFGFFYTKFSPSMCRRFYMLAPVMKVLQIMVSQCILAHRTYNVSRRSRRVGIFLIVFAIIITILEWFTNMYGRILVQTFGNCIASNAPNHLVTYSFYIVAMVYDLVTLGMSTFFLLESAPDRNKMTDLIKMMLYDGLGYMFVLSGINAMNIILYRDENTSVQTSGASVAYTVVWIMSQRLLLHVRAAAERLERPVVTAHELSTARDAADAMRSQFVTKEDQPRSVDLDIQVQIERAVTSVEYESYTYRRETYRKPKVIWDTR